MRAADLRGLRPFIGQVELINRALNHPPAGRCVCVKDTAGRWQRPRAVDPARPVRLPRCSKGSCRTVNHTAARAYLTFIRLRPDHLTDDALDTAVASLYALTLRAGRLTLDELVAGVHAAMGVPMPAHTSHLEDPTPPEETTR